MENQNNEFINFNGINKNLVHERTNNEGGKYYSVAIPVKNDVSRNGLANITLSEKQYAAFVHESKSDAGKVNIGIPANSNPIKVNVCKYADREDKSKNKYDSKEMSVKELHDAYVSELTRRKEAAKAKEEADGPER